MSLIDLGDRVGSLNPLALFFHELLQAGCSERDARLFVRLKGLDDGETQPQCSAGVGVSQARVCQIIKRVEEGAVKRIVRCETAGAKRLLSLLRDYLDSIYTLAPASTGSISESLRERERAAINPASLIRLADLVGVGHFMEITQWVMGYSPGAHRGKRRLGVRAVEAIVRAGEPSEFAAFIGVVTKYSQPFPVISLSHLLEGAAQCGLVVGGNLAEEYLKPFARVFGPFDGEKYFAINDTSKVLASRLVQILDVVQHVHLDRFVQGFYKGWRAKKGYVVTAQMLAAHRELILALGFAVDRGVVSLGSYSKASCKLGENRILVKMLEVFLSENYANGKLPLKGYLSALIENGVKVKTAKMYLKRYGIFNSVGGQVEIAVAAGAPAQTEVQRADVPTPWLDDAELDFLAGAK